MFCTTSVLEKCLGCTKPSWWSYSCLAGDTFQKPKSCKTMFLTTKAFSTNFSRSKKLPLLLVSTWTSYKTIIKILQLQKEEARHVLILYLFCYSGFVAVFDILSFVKLNQSLMKEQLYKVDQETRGNSKIRWLQLSRFAVLCTIVRHFCLYNPTGLLLLNIEILWKLKYFFTNP